MQHPGRLSTTSAVKGVERAGARGGDRTARGWGTEGKRGVGERREGWRVAEGDAGAEGCRTPLGRGHPIRRWPVGTGDGWEGGVRAPRCTACSSTPSAFSDRTRRAGSVLTTSGIPPTALAIGRRSPRRVQPCSCHRTRLIVRDVLHVAPCTNRPSIRLLAKKLWGRYLGRCWLPAVSSSVSVPPH